jgi:hypothetical protein
MMKFPTLLRLVCRNCGFIAGLVTVKFGTEPMREASRSP